MAFISYSVNENELNFLAEQFGTDKGPQAHNYTPIYDNYFNHLRGQPINLLEIGFWKGDSAAMWNSYFTHPDSRLYFIDFNPTFFERIKKLGRRCSAHLVDQGKQEELLKFVSFIQKSFDIIIDDGSHSMNPQLTSFKILFPYLKKGRYVHY